MTDTVRITIDVTAPDRDNAERWARGITELVDAEFGDSMRLAITTTDRDDPVWLAAGDLCADADGTYLDAYDDTGRPHYTRLTPTELLTLAHELADHISDTQPSGAPEIWAAGDTAYVAYGAPGLVHGAGPEFMAEVAWRSDEGGQTHPNYFYGGQDRAEIEAEHGPLVRMVALPVPAETEPEEQP